LGYIITREDIEDNLYIKKGMQRTKNLKFVMLQTKERIGILPFDRAFSNTYAIGDGVALISTSHPTAAGNRSNRLSYDADLSELVLEQSMIDIMDFRDNAGNNIRVNPKTLVIHPHNLFNATRLLKNASNQPDTAERNINALYLLNSIPGGIVVNRYLADTDSWYILTDVPEGRKCYQRRALEFTDDNDFDTENAKFKATERYSFGTSDWRSIYGCPGG